MNKVISLLLLLLFGCSDFNRSGHIIREDEKLVNEIIKKTAIDIKVKTGLQPYGTGAQMMDQVKMLALSFKYYEPIQLDEARVLLTKSVDALVSAVNADERIRPYLYNYPFEPKNVEIRIFLERRDSVDVPPGELSVVSSIDGIFNYKIDNPQTNLFTKIHTETYEEAKKKANSPPP